MNPRLRRFALTAHITASVGWLGAIVGFLALAVAGVASEDVETVRSAYLMMEMFGWFVLVPFAIASLVTGLVQSLGTKWGLFRHYWVLAKLLINLFATVVLLAYMQTLRELREITAATSLADLDAVRSPSPLLHAGAALGLLLVAIILAVYKPRGMTAYGQRKQREQRAPRPL
jgi:uncharacterized membrane protein